MRAQLGSFGNARHRVPSMVLLVFLASLSIFLSSCTRAEVASAMATVAVDLQATLEPFSATVEAGGLLQGLPTRAATSSAPVDALVPSASPAAPTTEPTLTLPVEALPTAIPPTPVPQPSSTPLPTATMVPTATPVPSPTPIPSPTPLPAEIERGGSNMVLVGGGFFQMGAEAADMLAECDKFRTGCDQSWFTASEPVHTVLVAPFYIDQFEVTNLGFLDFLNAAGTEQSPCGEQACIDLEQSGIESVKSGSYQVAPESATNPVSGVTWFGAAAFCEWRDSRLPTEAEWEKAALWDQDTETGSLYPWGDDFDGTRVNFCDAQCDEPQANADYDDGFALSAPVGSLPQGISPYGAYDMAGNLWEWVSDWYGETYYADSPTNNPVGTEEGPSKVVRGGSWFDTGNFTSGRIRFPSEPDNADKTIGFRCATSGQ